MKYRAILLFGAPGAGKGTQGKILGTIPNFFHFACGDVFRNMSVESEIGRVFIEYSSRGELVPDEPTIRLWRQHIENMTQTGQFNPATDTMVLDGIPRNLAQAKMLADTVKVRAVINLHCPDVNKLIKRLHHRALRENRLDDANLKIIRNRQKTYDLQTKPVLDFYGKKLVHNVDSTQKPVKVLSDILRIIAKL
ncbi:MAG: nucleoside monophosphate kinase [Verrucomicrobia bacterium]|nr:nucleoside monophosphate kinase [Verrucomicrobiota bacterium]